MDREYRNNCLLVFRKVSEMLNKEIRKHGKLQRNNKVIWEALHSMDNDLWQMYLTGIKVVDKEFGHLVEISELATVLELERVIDQYGYLSQSGNLLTPYKTRKDPHNYKGTAWKMICQGREIWCRAMQIDLPNDDSSKQSPSDNILNFGS